MKFLLVICYILSALTFESVGQTKRKERKVLTNVDTINVFERFDDKFFKEKNVYWKDNEELGIIHSQRFDDPCCVDEEYELNLTLIFDDWNEIETNKEIDIAGLRKDCEIKEIFGGQRFDIQLGHIRLMRTLDDRLEFYFNVTAISKKGDKVLIYEGGRQFRPDH